MSRAARRVLGARPWEIEHDIQVAEVRRAQDERFAREHQQRRDRALACARRHGAGDHWHAYWLMVGVDEYELASIRVEVILGESS